MFKPMLATNTKVKGVKLPVIGSKKLEGVRGEFTPTGLKTRPMKEFGNPWLAQKFHKVLDFAKEKNIYIEGEFYKHGMSFNEISSICRRKHHPGVDDIEFHIFDCYIPDMPEESFYSRAKYIELFTKTINDPAVVCVKQNMFLEHKKINEAYESALKEGYEGYVLKNPDEAYKLGRSTHNEQKFLRIKEENTYDGVVVEIVEMMENLVESVENELGYMSKRQDKDMKEGKGMAAVAITKFEEFDQPIRVTLSRGLTDQDRKHIWDNKEKYIGKHLRMVGIPVKGMLPRAPRFDVWRTDLD